MVIYRAMGVVFLSISAFNCGPSPPLPSFLVFFIKQKTPCLKSFVLYRLPFTLKCLLF